MRTLTGRAAVGITLAIALVVSLMPTFAGAAAPEVPTLVDIRAAHHPGYDRIVFEFSGGLPDVTRVRWVDALRLDPSDRPAKVQGNAFLTVLFRWAMAHDDAGQPTVSPLRRAYDLPNIAHVALIGDFEFVVGDDPDSLLNPAAKGTFDSGKGVKEVTFPARKGRFICLRALSELSGKPFTSIAEISLIGE